MELQELQRNWDLLGKEDPLWAIITTNEKKGNKWDLGEFFASGDREIVELMQYLSDLGVQCAHHRALDFGCGVGRLTQPLARHFTKVIGVDIAPSMIAQARALDREGRCQFVVNERADLSLFPDHEFDFIYSNIVLQHMRPVYSTGYIREFCRVLVPGGVAVFQLPNLCKLPEPKTWKDVVRPLIPSPLLRWYRHRYRGLPVEQPSASQPAQMEMYTVPKRQVLRLVKRNGCRLVDAIQNTSSGPSYESWRYCIVKR